MGSRVDEQKIATILLNCTFFSFWFTGCVGQHLLCQFSDLGYTLGRCSALHRDACHRLLHICFDSSCRDSRVNVQTLHLSVNSELLAVSYLNRQKREKKRKRENWIINGKGEIRHEGTVAALIST
ncbi:hypothetical protein ILYODFUR_013414 [Ilyodon furcidens]|uniref:Uncharacterized protein n=1 Tax=Ilyodon furcidens TaxID=33524 RepID=A0ABV0TIA2_9TELE